MSSEFADLLARLEAEVAPGADDVPAIGEAIRAFREALPGATNLGETGDARDLYVLLDHLVAAVAAAHPGSLCRSGCSGCCDSQTAVFDVSPAEWRGLARHMASQWDEDQRAAFRSRFGREHAGRLRAYRLLGWIRHFEPIADAYFGREPYRCPFLVEGRCSVYAARPLACRMYGYFALRARWTQPAAVYACRMQTDYFETRPTLSLPSVNTVVAGARRLLRGRARILPLWIAKQISTLNR